MEAPSKLEEQQIEERARTVSPSQSLWAGIAAFIGGAAISGASHFTSTRKTLEEEGISNAARLKAVPTAGKALAVASGMTVIVGGLVYVLCTQTGLVFKPEAEVATLHDAMTLAEQQRNLVRDEFQKRIGKWQESEPQVRP